MQEAGDNLRQNPSSTEITMGLKLFFTGTKGTGGKLRKRTEDFVVVENSLYPAKAEPAEGAKFSVATVRAFNWETNRLVKVMARSLGIRKTGIQFAGTKDKRAITTQLFTFEAKPEEVEKIKLPDVEISDVYASHHRLKLGRLYGNKFDILLSDPELEGKELTDNIESTRLQLDELNGFPNFFGVQRFGAVRPITHKVGRFIIRRKFEDAVWEYIGNPIPEDKIGFESRSNLVKTKDLEQALNEFPKELEFERAIIHYLIDNPEDYIGAMRRFPQNLLSMFVHSYQSYIFNQIICERLENGISIAEPQLGDLMLAVDSDGIPIHTQWFSVNVGNLSKLKRLAAKKRAFVSGLLFGAETQFAEGVMGDIERTYVEKEGLKPDDFVIPELLANPSRGIRRELVAPVKDFSVDISEHSARCKFSLNKGTYATSLLREYMKAEARNY
jgi:tRNA pseudouridine13 synthase